MARKSQIDIPAPKMGQLQNSPVKNSVTSIAPSKQPKQTKQTEQTNKRRNGANNQSYSINRSRLHCQHHDWSENSG